MALFSLPLEDFVKKELEDQLNRPSVAREEVVGAIQGAFVQGLLSGDHELYERQMQYARMAHAYFFSQQSVKNALNPQDLRMAQMDPDFNVVCGAEFSALVTQLDLDDAEKLYDAVPNEIRVFGYDFLVQRYKEALDEQQKGGGRGFDQIFPQPPGIEVHRQRMEELAKRRGHLPNVEQK
jgi:hypothetical protein